MKFKKLDILLMTYEFIFGGIIFWVIMLTDFYQNNLLGNAIAPLNSVGISLLMTLGDWILVGLFLIGGIIFLTRREIYRENNENIRHS